MGLEQLFEVATEFKFDIGQALVNTKTLQDSVDGLSQSANSALGSLSYLASGLVAHLGFGSGGLLSVLTKAVQISEEFDASALSFSNNISSNMGLLSGTIHTFNDRLATSQMILDDISSTAIKFAIPTGDLAKMTSLIATPLAQHKRLGTNYAGAIEMSKNLTLGAQATGINPQVASESLYRALTDHMPLHGALFARLVNTQAFKSAGVNTQMRLQGMRPEAKIDLLDKALKSLASDSDALEYRLGSLHGQFTILQDLFISMGSVLKPIGDAIKKPLVKILKGINDYFKDHGKEIGENVGKLIANIFDDPKSLFVNLMQLKSFGSDFKKALHLVELFGTFKFIRYILFELLGITLGGGLIRAMFSSIWSGVSMLIGLVPWAKVMSGVFTVLGTALGEILPLFAGFLIFFQILSRARAIAQVQDATNWLNLAPKVSEMFVRLKTAVENILLPINMMIDFFARLLAPFFETSTWLIIVMPLLELFTVALEKLGHAVINVMAAVSAWNTMLIGMFDNIMKGNSPFKDAGKNLSNGYQDFLDANKARLGGDQMKATANYVTNVGKIEARFDMREQLEPDRIAFAVTSHLKKLASNPQQARGQSLAKPFSGSMAFAGGH